MLARAYAYLERSLADVEAVFKGPSRVWLAGLDGDSGELLLARVGIELRGLQLYRHVRVIVGEPALLADAGTTIPIAWHPSGGDAILPNLHGTLDIEAVGTRTQVSLNASYTPPLGFLGEVANRLLMYRLADAAVHDFVQRLTRNVDGILASADRPDRPRPSAAP